MKNSKSAFNAPFRVYECRIIKKQLSPIAQTAAAAAFNGSSGLATR